jgi:hypothetical protein
MEVVMNILPFLLLVGASLLTFMFYKKVRTVETDGLLYWLIVSAIAAGLFMQAAIATILGMLLPS